MVDLNRRSLFRGRRAPALRPPWARRPDEAFTDACTRCGDCQRACPEGIVVVADGGFPALDFRQGAAPSVAPAHRPARPWRWTAASSRR